MAIAAPYDEVVAGDLGGDDVGDRLRLRLLLLRSPNRECRTSAVVGLTVTDGEQHGNCVTWAKENGSPIPAISPAKVEASSLGHGEERSSQGELCYYTSGGPAQGTLTIVGDKLDYRCQT